MLMLLRDELPLAHVSRMDLKPQLSEREAEIRLFQLSMASRAVLGDWHGRAGWICLHVERNFERAVENVLMRGCVESYLPCWPGTKTARRGNCRRPKNRPGSPVYPSYVLVRCALSTDALLGIEAIRHVYCVIGGAERPALCSDQSVSRFKEMVDKGMLQEIEADLSMQPGERVRVIAGPFADHYVTVVSVKEDSAVVELALLGHSHDIPMPLAFLERL